MILKVNSLIHTSNSQIQQLQTFFGKQLEMWLQTNSCPFGKFLCKLFEFNLVRTEVKMIKYETMGNISVRFCHQLQLHLNSSLKFFSLFDSSQRPHLHRNFNRFLEVINEMLQLIILLSLSFILFQKWPLQN